MPKRKQSDFDIDEYHKLLADLFPSNYIIEKTEQIVPADDTYITLMREQIDYIFNYMDPSKITKLNVLHELLNTYPLDKDKINTEFNKKINIILNLLDKRICENITTYNHLLSTNHYNDEEYFKKSKPIEQENILQQLKSLQRDDMSKPYLIQLLESNMPERYKLIGLNKINQLRTMDKTENNKLVNWVETFLKLPFNTSAYLPVTIYDGIENCQKYMAHCESILNDCVYGMEEAKGQIMQIIGKWITNPESIGTAIGLKGPMGTGKTTLVKHGISKILNREFAFITLGGSVDGSTLKGHSYTYEGSKPGKLAEILIQCKTNNPVIFFDELDKVSQTDKGQEIYGVLTHLTDTTQNNQFQDYYLSEIDLDMSKCLFIFSYNDESLINPILKDRMYTIEIPGYNVNDKIHICEKHLIPAIEKDIGINPNDFILSRPVLKFLIEKTKPEEGVRNLKRNIETIYNKLNLFRILKQTTLFKDVIDVILPFTITESIIKLLIKIYEPKLNTSLMYI
jgi:ATP-dependent Lon protease